MQKLLAIPAIGDFTALAVKLKTMFVNDPRTRHFNKHSEIVEIFSKDFYGEGYQDIDRRVPSIAKAKELIGWEPTVDLDTALGKTLDYYLATSLPGDTVG